MDEEKTVVALERENRKLREKLRKAEARAKQAEAEAAKLDGMLTGMWFGLQMAMRQNGESRAIPLIKFLWECSKADAETNNRLRRQKAAWMKEEAALVKLAAEPCLICKGGCDEDGECVFEWNGGGAE